MRRSASNPRPSRPRTAPAPAPCVARTSVGLRLPQASLHAVVAGARRRVDPCCPPVQVARGGQMEPLKGSWRAPPAQLAAAARPQARPQLWVPWARLGRLVGPCSDRCAGLCAYSPCGVCVRLMSRSSSLVVYFACRCVQTHGKRSSIVYRRADRTNTRLRRSRPGDGALVSSVTHKGYSAQGQLRRARKAQTRPARAARSAQPRRPARAPPRPRRPMLRRLGRAQTALWPAAEGVHGSEQRRGARGVRGRGWAREACKAGYRAARPSRCRAAARAPPRVGLAETGLTGARGGWAGAGRRVRC